MMDRSDIENSWFSLSPNPQVRLRLFCFPNAGGGIATLHNWFRRLPPEIQLCPVQLPARENRRMEAPFTRIGPLVRAIADVMPTEMEVPFALLGHSFGTLIAFELARELRRRNRPGPLRLIVSARRAPQVPDAAPHIHQLSEERFLAALRGHYGAVPDAILAEPELLRIFLPVLRADMEILETYTYTPEGPLTCPISAFGGLDDPTVGQPGLAAWAECTSSTFTLRMFPGDHFFPRNIRPGFLAAIAEDLLDSLPRLTTEQSSSK
jgi:medium-chain acyl-[acyl-carrier-protein] hydrolase